MELTVPGEKNAMYGVSPKERMDEETYKGWREKQRKNNFGKDNPNYGNTALHDKYKANPDLAKEKQSRPGEQNGRCVPIALYEDGVFIKEFPYKRACVVYLNEIGVTTTKGVGAIDRSLKTGKPAYGRYTFKILTK